MSSSRPAHRNGAASEAPSATVDDDARTVSLGDEAPKTADWGARLEQGAALGRYVVLHRIGEGGAGVVYAAYDPELDRKVAVKLLRAAGDADDEGNRERLMREAQAMARLSHPNVVAVYDVGTMHDRVFVAMELAQGGSLRRWLREKPRVWREVLGAYLEAARGLAAAHAAGMIHRDFKPDNAVVGVDGRVRVTDFGLVHVFAGPSAHALSSSSMGSSASRTPPSPRKEGRQGTPGYMAPEQYRGEEPTVHTDQFSFCVALYEALYGRRPFPGDTPKDIEKRTCAGALEPPPRESPVPPWIFAVLRRGLSVIPGTRYPSMDALVAALDPRPREARVRRWAAFVAMAATLATAAFVYRQSVAKPPPCEGAARRLEGVWDDAIRARLRQRFVESGSPTAREAATATAQRLDAYAQEWTSMQKEACEATWVRREQSPELLDQRTACLATRLHEVRTLVGELVRADRRAVGAAADAASGLSSLRACTAAAVLEERAAQPSDTATRAQVQEAREKLAEATVLVSLGQRGRARTPAEAGLATARRVGYAPAEAEALLTLGNTLEGEDAAQRYRQATLVADAAAHDRVRAEALTMLVFTVGYELEKPDEGIRIAEEAKHVIQRVHDRELEAVRLRRLSWVYGLTQPTLAVEAAARAYELTEQLWPADARRVADALNGLANAHYQVGDGDAAEGYWQRAIERCRADLPQTACARYRNNLAIVYTDRGKPELAAAVAQEAVASTSPEEDVSEYVTALNALALAEIAKGSPEDALRHAELAQAVATDPVLAFEARSARGSALARLGRAHEAIPFLREGLAILEREKLVLAAESGATQFELAKALYDTGARDEARLVAEKAAADLTKAPTHARLLADVRSWLAAHGPSHASR